MSTPQGKAFDVGLFRRVMGFVRPYKRLFWTTFALTILLSLLSVVRPVLMAVMVDDHAAKGDLHGLYLLMAALVALLALEAVVQFHQAYWTSWLGQTVTIDLRQALFAKLVRFRMRFFDRTPIGTLVTRVVSDIETIEEIFSQGLLSIMGDLLKLVVVVVVMFAYNWELALWSMVPIPLLLWATRIFKNAIQRSFVEVRNQVARLNAFVQEHIQGMSIVQLFGRERQEHEKFRQINRQHRGAHIRSVLAYSVFFPVVDVLSAVSLAFLLWWGVGDVLQGVATFGELIAYIQFINMLYRPMRQLADRFNVLQMGMVGSQRVFTLLDTAERMDDHGTMGTEEVKGDIEFKDLWFAYIDDDHVLKGISFKAKAGEKIALVGATGSGKSSIVNVLSRAYDFQQGQVLLDGHDIRSYRLDELRKSISVVLQDVFLFSDTVHNNITLNDERISRDQVVAAAKAVGAHAFIMQLPQGYDTSVRERGAILSTGQRQLLAFIRAYVNAPKVLVLDEATSSVDSHSEQLIQAATDRITQGRTSIIIAHRLSTVQKADKILVVEAGHIIEQGSHQELLAFNGAYRKLYDLQFAMEAR
ncbi:MAG: ABC transporter ATP-binding protein [Flavobacteriales bacterium]|nr:ABC transporter ATP-binding protein [Flavobacteriales bacterium]MBP9079337.1 ABC transporter ATP-binding protein [Flavobacteriales bacterium]